VAAPSDGILPGDPGTERVSPGPLERLRLTAMAASQLARERRIAYADPEKLAHRRRRRIRRIVAHAHANVPHYRDEMRRLGIEPEDIRDAGDLKLLPIVTREQVQAEPERFRSERADPRECLTVRSSGSVSIPIVLLKSPRDLVLGYTSVVRPQAALRAAGVSSLRRRILRIVPPASSTAAIHTNYRRSLLSRWDPRTSAVTISMGTDPDEVVALINDFRPDLLSGYGSALAHLFAHLARTGRPFHRPRVVSYSADRMPPRARELIAGEFGIQVLSTYQGIETPQIGFECELNSGYHLNHDVCPVRVVDPEGNDLPAGEPGEVIVSNLLAETTVFLNYKLGDRATALAGGCGCGRTLPLLGDLHGRTGETGVGVGGRRIPIQVLTRPFSLDTGVWSYRVDQTEPGRFVAELVTVANADDEEVAARVRQRFRAIVGPDEALSLEFVDELQRTAGGKVVHLTSARELQAEHDAAP
jgi:phenylacetate-CoA ligase